MEEKCCENCKYCNIVDEYYSELEDDWYEVYGCVLDRKEYNYLDGCCSDFKYV